MAETETRPRRWQFFSRGDRDETLVRLETETSRPRPQPFYMYLETHHPSVNLCKHNLTTAACVDIFWSPVWLIANWHIDNNCASVTSKQTQNVPVNMTLSWTHDVTTGIWSILHYMVTQNSAVYGPVYIDLPPPRISLAFCTPFDVSLCNII